MVRLTSALRMVLNPILIPFPPLKLPDPLLPSPLLFALLQFNTVVTNLEKGKP